VRTERGEETLLLDEFEARVREGRIPPSTPVRFPVLTGERWVDARDLELFRRLYEPARIHFTRSFTLGGFPAVTTMLVIGQILLFFGIAGAERVQSLDGLIRAGAKVPSNIAELGETWRLITANLLHRDVLHLLANMFFLFNVGGAIENAYRRQDYLLILAVSAVSTTLMSTLMSRLPSVGASGMVLGLFGAASVFGYKYADILPRRYRRYFGGMLLPYTLFILYVGLATPDTDNWGHLGGLLGGSIAAFPLEPRLLRSEPDRRPLLIRLAPALVATLVLAAVLLAGPILKRMPPRTVDLVDTESGFSIGYPARWQFGDNHLGYGAFGNPLGVSLGVRAHRDAAKPFQLERLKKQFLEEELGKREREGEISGVRVLDERPMMLDGVRATELVIALESRAGTQRTRNVLIARGFYSYFLVLSAPEAFADAYQDIFDRLLERVHFYEPAKLEKSRTMADTFPGMSSAHAELGNDLAAMGDVSGAAAAYARALQALPEQPDALFGLAKLAADYGGDLESAEGIAARLHEKKPDDAAVAVLLADLREQLGRVDGARAALLETLDRAPDTPELRQRLLRLR
jgi:membrane associated rhomboid family serine protease